MEATSTGPRPVLTLEAASRSYGRIVALAPLTLRLHAGTICLVTGPNGSGKTTLLCLAAGIATPGTGAERHERNHVPTVEGAIVLVGQAPLGRTRA